MENKNHIRVLFICTGNICRSPMAEFLFKHIVNQAGEADRFTIESAATSSWEIGEPIHPGTQKVLTDHAIPFDRRKRARQVTPDDYLKFDIVLAMDSLNLRHMPNLEKIERLTDYAPAGSPMDVPDPYYTGDFEGVYQLIHASCGKLFEKLKGHLVATHTE